MGMGRTIVLVKQRATARRLAGLGLVLMAGAAGSLATSLVMAAPTDPRPSATQPTAPVLPPAPPRPTPSVPAPKTPPSSARPAAPPSVRPPAASFAEARVEPMRLYDEERCVEAMPLLRALTNRPDFPKDDAEQAVSVWDAVAYCAGELDLWSESHDALVRATSYELAGAEFWEARFYAAAAAKRWPDAITTLETLVEREPKLVRAIDSKVVSAVWSWLDEGSDLENRYLEVLWASRWQPDSPFDSADSYLLIYADRLRLKGEDRKARQVLRGVSEPGYIYTARLHPGLKTYIPVEPSGMNVRASAERRASALALRAFGDPDRIDLVIAQAGMLRRLGRPAEALALLDGTRRRVDLEADKGGYRDIAVWRGPWWAHRADALFDLGKDDEAIASLAYGASLPETVEGSGDSRNVTQVGQLAELQLNMGRYDEAIATLDRLRGREDVSEGGLISHARIRACALAGKGDLKGAQRLADRNARLAEAGAFNWTRLQLCAGRVDPVAKAYPARLSGTDGEKASALEELSPFGRRARRTSFSDAEDARWKALVERPDMARAIQAAGGLEPWPLVP